jgi:hypothetical protein
VIHNLPFPPNPTFTGRDLELKNLSEQLQKVGEMAITQTIAVHGIGGVGKTQLAVEYAWKHLGDYDAVLWVKADSPEALDASLAALAPVLGLPEANEREQAIQTKAVLDWLHGHERWLPSSSNCAGVSTNIVSDYANCSTAIGRARLVTRYQWQKPGTLPSKS